MFSQAMCECQCIPPFCADTNGDCTRTSNCGEVKWKDCTPGMNCPWYVNVLRAESCATSPDVPVGMWKIWITREECCKTNFANSDTCDIQLTGGDQPTRHPTIVALKDDFEVVPIKFDVMGLPDSTSVRQLKDEMAIVLRRVLIRLSERIPGLKVKNVEEKVVMNRSLEKSLRALAKDVTLYFNVNVVRDDDRQFGPLIIAAMRDSYDEVLTQIQTFTDTSYFGGGNLNLNFCTSQGGKFELCTGEVYNNPPQNQQVAWTPVPVPAEVSTQSGSENGGVGSLPVWGILLIVILIFWLLACLAGFIFFYCRDTNENKDVQNNIYMEDVKSRDGSRYMSRLSSVESTRSESSGSPDSSESTRSPAPRRNSRQLVLAVQQTRRSENSSFATSRSKKKQSRDPTMFYPGQEDAPDPDSDVLMITDGGSTSRRYYTEDPPLKPKRDPSTYVKGKYSRDPSMFSAEDPSNKVKRDPTMYVKGRRDPTMYVEGQHDPSMYVEGRRDPSMYAESSSASIYMDGNEERSAAYSVSAASSRSYASDRKDPSYYESNTVGSNRSESFCHQEPRVSGRSKKSKKKSKRNISGHRKSLQSDWDDEVQDDWGASLPHVHGAPPSDISRTDRQVKSFYK